VLGHPAVCARLDCKPSHAVCRLPQRQSLRPHLVRSLANSCLPAVPSLRARVHVCHVGVAQVRLLLEERHPRAEKLASPAVHNPKSANDPRCTQRMGQCCCPHASCCVAPAKPTVLAGRWSTSAAHPTGQTKRADVPANRLRISHHAEMSLRSRHGHCVGP